MLAEDDPNDAELTLNALHEHQLANCVDVVRDGAEALDYLYRRGRFAGRRAGDPAVILLDIKMPKVDGLEVLKQIRTDKRLRSLRVVILTASREEEDRFRSYQLGVNGYVVKPVDFSEFAHAVAELGLFWALVNEPPLLEGCAASEAAPVDMSI